MLARKRPASALPSGSAMAPAIGVNSSRSPTAVYVRCEIGWAKPSCRLEGNNASVHLGRTRAALRETARRAQGRNIRTAGVSCPVRFTEQSPARNPTWEFARVCGRLNQLNGGTAAVSVFSAANWIPNKVSCNAVLAPATKLMEHFLKGAEVLPRWSGIVVRKRRWPVPSR